MGLKGKTVVILVEDVYQEMELYYPYYRLKEEEATVILAGPEAGKTYKSKLGYPAQSDKAASDIDPAQVDGIVIPGGYAPDRMRRHPAMLSLVREVYEAGKPVAAICHAPWVTISAGVMKGTTSTSFIAIKDDVLNAGSEWIDADVVVDGNLITSRTPDDLPAFMKAFIAAMK